MLIRTVQINIGVISELSGISCYLFLIY